MPSDDNDYRLLNILSQAEDQTQREVAKQAGLSLGMVNLVLKRLAKTGYIKVSRLSGHTVRYVLTPKGSAELAKRSYDYLLHVISSFGELREGIAAVLAELRDQADARSVLLYGEGDVADIALLASGDLDGLEVHRQREGPVAPPPGAVVLDCRVGVAPAERVGIPVLEAVAAAAARPTSDR